MKSKEKRIKAVIIFLIISFVLSGLIYSQSRSGRRRRATPVQFSVNTVQRTENTAGRALGLIIPLIIMLIFGMISSVIANNKGRNNWLWFFIGLIPPWGLVLVALLPKTQVAIVDQELQKGTMRKCPYCAEAIKTEAVKCKHCGEESSHISRQ
jgi:hypothetical protein